MARKRAKWYFRAKSWFSVLVLGTRIWFFCIKMFQVSNLRYFGTIFAGRNEHGRLAACNPEPMGSKQLSMAMPLPSHEEYAMGNINDLNIDDFFEDSDHAIDKAASDLANANPKDAKFREVLFRRAEVLVDTETVMSRCSKLTRNHCSALLKHWTRDVPMQCLSPWTCSPTNIWRRISKLCPTWSHSPNMQRTLSWIKSTARSTSSMKKTSRCRTSTRGLKLPCSALSPRMTEDVTIPRTARVKMILGVLTSENTNAETI